MKQLCLVAYACVAFFLIEGKCVALGAPNGRKSHGKHVKQTKYFKSTESE